MTGFSLNVNVQLFCIFRLLTFFTVKYNVSSLYIDAGTDFFFLKIGDLLGGGGGGGGYKHIVPGRSYSDVLYTAKDVSLNYFI